MIRYYHPPPPRWPWLQPLKTLVRSLLVFGALALPLFSFQRPPTIPTELGPQQTVLTAAPHLALHTRLTDEVEPWKIKQTLVMARQMGAPVIIEYFPWAYSEPRRGKYDWSHADLVVDHALRQGLTVVARLDLVPDWARPQQSSSRLLTEDRFPDYARFAAAFATHFRNRIHTLILWNEPNLAFEWGGRHPDPVGYTRLLALAYQAVKAANPNMEVLAAGLAPTLARPGDEAAMSDLTFLEEMYAAGAAPYFDGLAMHAYGWRFSADDPPDPNIVNFRRVELLRDIMVRHGDGHKPAPITEAGWNDHPRWTKAVRPTARIQYTLDAFDLVKTWDWCPYMAVWAFRFPWPSRTYSDNWALLDEDFTPRPIYAALSAYGATGRADHALRLSADATRLLRPSP